ncbi:hypothetical protein [Microbulbifer magnicolonia]|uniref:hypothetical protein n=1 Tax=Microbulbifer magnicolonia TaxID=3109744 RepID=UPI002B4053F3|nr:hypothetical protein [Microbulbifer sp. GG15]
MNKEAVKKSRSYALIPLGVGAGQYLAGLISGEQNTSVIYIAIFSVLTSLATFAILMVFFPWWESKRSNLGESSPMSVYQSPVLWVPLILVALYLFHRIANA